MKILNSIAVISIALMTTPQAHALSCTSSGFDLEANFKANKQAGTDITYVVGGNATEGTDYNNGSTVSDITISAGATTGTATLTPVADTNYEGGSETANKHH